MLREFYGLKGEAGAASSGSGSGTGPGREGRVGSVAEEGRQKGGGNALDIGQFNFTVCSSLNRQASCS
jgi:hypothetical protein